MQTVFPLVLVGVGLPSRGESTRLFLWNRLLCSPFVVTRQVRLTKFLPAYKHTSEKSLPWGALFRMSVV